MKNLLLYLLFSLCISSSVLAQGVNLDASFSGNGFDKIQFLPASGIPTWDGQKVVIDNDQNIYSIGIESPNFDVAHPVIAKYNPNGVLDTTYGGDGKTEINPFPSFFSDPIEVFVQSNGKIVGIIDHTDYVGGADYLESTIFRQIPNGGLDLSYGNNGYISIDTPMSISTVHCATMLSDDKIILVGSEVNSTLSNNKFAIARLKTNGDFDSSFATNGVYVHPVYNSNFMYAFDVNTMPGGEILVTTGHPSIPGYNILKFNSNGQLDTTFQNQGILNIPLYDTIAYPRTILSLSNGKFLVFSEEFFPAANPTNYHEIVRRYNTDGSLDGSFGNNGSKIVSFSNFDHNTWFSKYKLYNGYFYVAGSDTTYHLKVCRLDSLCNVDLSYGDNGYSYLTTGSNGGSDVAIQNDGKAVVVGSGNSYVWTARFLADLSVGLIEWNNPAIDAWVYPNPVNHQAQLKFSLLEDEKIMVLLQDMQGKTVQTFYEQYPAVMGENTLRLDFNAQIPSGMYFLQIQSTQGNYTIKVVK